MAKSKAPVVVDTSAGTAAYKLAVANEAALDPRLPAGTVANLAADLTTLGANPNPAPAPSPGAPAAPPSLAEATGLVVALVSAVHEALVGAKVKSDVRKAYGVSAKTPTKEAAALLADGAKVVARAQELPAEALSFGILPGDVTALAQALAALSAAEAAAKGSAGKGGGATGKDRRAAETRMHEATARIAGAGALAFATNAALRAQFEALKPAKKK